MHFSVACLLLASAVLGSPAEVRSVMVVDAQNGTPQGAQKARLLKKFMRKLFGKLFGKRIVSLGQREHQKRDE